MALDEKGTKLKTINKCAYIRSNEIKGCPFGLPIADGCKCAGEAIDRLCPLESVKPDEGEYKDSVDEEKEKSRLAKLNRKVFFYTQEGKPCKYAINIVRDKNMVNCNWGDTAEGWKIPTFEGSPFYPKIQTGSFTGLYSAPITFFYSLDMLYRNYPYGLFSYYGSLSNFFDFHKEDIVKLADKYDSNGETEKSDLIDGIIKKIESGHDISIEEAKQFLEVCRNKFDKERITPKKEQDMVLSPRSKYR